MARARLRDKHQENLKKKLELLKAAQNVSEDLADVDIKLEPDDDESQPASGTSKQEDDEEKQESSDDEEEEE